MLSPFPCRETSLGQARKANAPSHLPSPRLGIAATSPSPPLAFKQEFTRLWAPSPAPELEGRADHNLPRGNTGKSHSRKELSFQVLSGNEEQCKAAPGGPGPALKWFPSVHGELELLHQDVCSFHLPFWTLVLLEAPKDARRIPTPPLLSETAPSPSN